MGLRPGYKQTELGEIPSDWETPSIGSLVSFTSGSGISVASLGSQSSETPIPVYGGNGIAGYTSKPLVRNPVVVVGRVGQKCGQVYLTDGPAWITDNALYPREVHRNSDMRFLSAALAAAGLNEFKNRNDLPLVTQTILHAVLIAFPPQTIEQTQIANALSEVDAYIESLKSLAAKKRQVKQGALQELLSGRRRLRGFSAGWAEKALGNLFSFSGGYSASRDQLSGKGHCYLHYGDIHQSSKSFIDLQAEYQDIPKLDISLKQVSSASLLDEGDVVFVDASEDDDGTSKHIVVANTGKKIFIAGLHTIVAKALTDDLTNEYRRYCFQTGAVKKQFLFYAVGTKVSGISKTNIAKITIPVPEVAEQAAIAEILITMDAELDALETKLTIAREVKQGMMQELLTGRIRLI